ncbi:MAG TPA: LysM peptidoglycan-binding domain-containing protein [Phenylobacterium sp.]|nr:LysM peptidoglycan-binding domain-containing protein [Phenylobacterium sp.]
MPMFTSGAAMTQFFQRSALILLATSALCVSPALARTHHHHKATASKSKAPAQKEESATYVVKPGDTLEKIADKLGVTVAELKAANKLKGNVIQPGDVLKSPGEPKATPVAASKKTYTVARGDTIFGIAKRLHVPVEELRQANGLSAKSKIKAGQTLVVPGGEPAASETAETGRRGHRGLPAAVEEASDAGAQRGANGRVVSTEGHAVTYRVRKGDTLEKVAAKLGTSVAAVKADNHIRGATIHPGQVLKGPRAAGGRAYVAASGDTVAGVAERFGVSTEALRRANGLSRHAAIHGGQRLHLPSGAHDRGVAREPSVATERPSRAYTRPVEPYRGETTSQGLPAHPIPYAPSGATPRPYIPPPGVQTQPPVSATPAPTDAQISQMGAGRFQWPLKGDLLSDFGVKPTGQRNDGVNIRAEAGAPVRAAADGDVVYAGDQVPGFGNLVLIKHADGWVTAYGHLSRVDVKMQQRVSQGQQIGQAGSTGGVPEPQVHFEVRYAPNPLERARPVDPKLVLPK